MLFLKNSILEIDGMVEFDNGDLIKIKPNTAGTTNINILTDELGCPVTWDSDFVACFNAPVPVTWLSSPTANIKNNQTLVSWSVASQVNNSHFIIEHSSDGRS
jgi:hypothetical protein